MFLFSLYVLFVLIDYCPPSTLVLLLIVLAINLASQRCFINNVDYKVTLPEVLVFFRLRAPQHFASFKAGSVRGRYGSPPFSGGNEGMMQDH